MMRRAWRFLLIVVALLALLVGSAIWRVVVMPGRSPERLPSEMRPEDEELAAELRRDLQILASDIGPRNVRTLAALRRSEEWIAMELRKAGCNPSRDVYEVEGIEVANVHVEIRGAEAPDHHLVVGAHYDTVDSPGANDNGSGTVALLALARRLCGISPKSTLDLVFFVNEEAPFGLTKRMGSYVFASRLAAKNPPSVQMISLETIGYYDDRDGTQRYPFPFGLFYPTRGNFVAFVGNSDSREFLCDFISRFRERSVVPSEGVAAPSFFRDVARSDHWAFWQFGYPAFMITDTANFRYPHYHTEDDTAEHVRYEILAAIVNDLSPTIETLVANR